MHCLHSPVCFHPDEIRLIITIHIGQNELIGKGASQSAQGRPSRRLPAQGDPNRPIRGPEQKIIHPVAVPIAREDFSQGALPILNHRPDGCGCKGAIALAKIHIRSSHHTPGIHRSAHQIQHPVPVHIGELGRAVFGSPRHSPRVDQRPIAAQIPQDISAAGLGDKARIQLRVSVHIAPEHIPVLVVGRGIVAAECQHRGVGIPPTGQPSKDPQPIARRPIHHILYAVTAHIRPHALAGAKHAVFDDRRARRGFKRAGLLGKKHAPSRLGPGCVLCATHPVRAPVAIHIGKNSRRSSAQCLIRDCVCL